MRYLSVCSGIEAASVAWHHLGWTPVGFSEIEPFPAAVLAHRFPHVPNYGDMTKFEEWPIEPGTVDLLVGGTPCQSYSVAGLRQGLADPRGSLMLTYLAIAARLQPRWVVWENVPGVLSSNGGRDFATFLSALGQLGYGWAYRVLDAQYVRVGRWPRAVPQRRRRVFVVGRLLERGVGDWTAAAQILALEEGLRRHIEAQSKKGKGSAPDAEGGAGGGCWWDGSDCAGTLTKQNAGGAQRMPDKDNLGAVLQPTAYRWQNDALGLQQDDAVAALRASAGSSGFHEMNHPVIAQPVAFAQNQREEVREVEVPGALAAEPGTHQQTYIAQPVPYDLFQITAPVNRQNRKPGDPCHTLARDNAAHAAIAIGTDCYNGAITGDVAATMGTPGSSVNASGPTVMQAVAFKPGQSASAHSIGAQEGVACTLEAGGGGNNKQAVALPINGMCLYKALHDKQMTGIGNDNDPVFTMRADGTQHAVAHSLRADGFDASEDGTGRGTPLVPVAPSLTATNDSSRSPQSSEVTQQVAAVHASTMTVRRLTPVECERLQGFPDNWTAIPWRKKQAEDCPNGPRYKALGNSMACNCMAWIGEKIAKWEADHA